MKNKLLFFYILTGFIFSSASVYALDRVIDNAGLLTQVEKAHLDEQIASVARTYNFDLVIVIETYEGYSDPERYADSFFDDNGYGYGVERDGCLFLQITQSRDYWVSASGKGIKMLNNTAFNRLQTDLVRYLSVDNYFEAYRVFILDWEEFLAMDVMGRSYNFFHRWNFVLIIVSWVFAVITGVVVIMSWKRKMNTALPQARADAYIVPGSLAFDVKSDHFLYSTVSKVRRQTQSSGGSSNSGRSSRGGGGKY